jgi:hypothetical protein
LQIILSAVRNQEVIVNILYNIEKQQAKKKKPKSEKKKENLHAFIFPLSQE